MEENIRVNQWGKSVEQKNKINTTLSPLSLRDEGPISLLLLSLTLYPTKNKEKSTRGITHYLVLAPSLKNSIKKNNDKGYNNQ